MNWNLINVAEFGSKILLISKYRRGGPNNSDILENWFPPEGRSPMSDIYKFQDSEKSTPELCRIHWNLITDNELVSKKLSKLKYWKGVHQTFCKIGSPQKLGPPCLISTNFKTLRKVLLNYGEYIKI